MGHDVPHPGPDNVVYNKVTRVACGRSLRLWKGLGISVLSELDGEFAGRSPSQFLGGSPQEMQGVPGGMSSRIKHLM